MMTILGACALVSACWSAKAEQPDSRNPSHCFAAFTYARTVLVGGARPDVNGAIQTTGRAMFEMRKIKASGSDDAARATGEALLASYSSNEPVMMKLVQDCLVAQDADPVFRALNESGQLMADARRADPLCKDDPSCVAGSKN